MGNPFNMRFRKNFDPDLGLPFSGSGAPSPRTSAEAEMLYANPEDLEVPPPSPFTSAGREMLFADPNEPVYRRTGSGEPVMRSVGNPLQEGLDPFIETIVLRVLERLGDQRRVNEGTVPTKKQKEEKKK